jgi:soluble lytic murein transglycosylase-like protein
VENAVSAWQTIDEGPTWMSALNAAEDKYGIPANLLARQCYQECHFRPDIISGATRSPAAAVGIMQLEPSSFPGQDIGKDPLADINRGANYLESLYHNFKDWQLALAAYDWGPGNVRKWLNYGGAFADMPKETRDYVSQICADVPVSGSLIDMQGE